MDRQSTLLAYFITFSTYGARLRGDPRGSVDRNNNGYDTPFVPPEPRLAAAHRDAMRWPASRMDDNERRIVADAIRNISGRRGWTLHAANVRTMHVHLVVEAGGETPEAMMRTFKAFATRALRRSGAVDGQRSVWSRHGSTRYLYEVEAVPSTVRYVVRQQGRSVAGTWYLAPGFVMDEA